MQQASHTSSVTFLTAVFSISLLLHSFSAFSIFAIPAILSSENSFYSIEEAWIFSFFIALLTYGAKPLGGWFWGSLEEHNGSTHSLSLCLLGASSVGLAYFYFPFEAGIGGLSALFFIKIAQTFCTSYNSFGVLNFFLERVSPSKKPFFSSFLGIASILGFLGASLFSSLILEGLCSWKEGYLIFSCVFFISSLFLIYWKKREKKHFFPLKKNETTPIHQKKNVYKNFYLFITAVLSAGFSYTTYSVSFIWSLSHAQIMYPASYILIQENTSLLLIFDILLLLFCAPLIQWFDSEKIMVYSAFLWTLFFPFSLEISTLSLESFFFVRVIYVIFGVLFSAPLYNFLHKIYGKENNKKIGSLAYILGVQLFGLPTAWILSVSDQLNSSLGVIYVVFLSSSTAISLWIKSLLIKEEDGNQKRSPFPIHSQK